MRGNSQKDNGFIRQIIAEAEFAVWNSAAFFADDKNHAEISVYPNTSAAFEIQPPGCVGQRFRVVVRGIEHGFGFFPDSFLQRGIPLQVADKLLFINCPVAAHFHTSS